MAEACNFIKKEALAQVFLCEFCEISKNAYFTEYLRETASVNLFLWKQYFINALKSNSQEIVSKFSWLKFAKY